MCDCPAHRRLVACTCLCDHTDDRTTQLRDRAAKAEAEADRLREALHRIYQSGEGRHVEIARDALDVEDGEMARGKPPVLWLSRAAGLERQAAVAPTACQRADLLAVAAGHRRHVGQDPEVIASTQHYNVSMGRWLKDGGDR